MSNPDRAAEQSPTPWKATLSTIYRQDQRGFIDEENIICSVINKPDAAFIVRAVNAHDELLAEVKKQRDLLKSIICPKPTEEIERLDALIARAESRDA